MDRGLVVLGGAGAGIDRGLVVDAVARLVRGSCTFETVAGFDHGACLVGGKGASGNPRCGAAGGWGDEGVGEDGGLG